MIRYELPVAASAQLGVYDASGRVVRRLASGTSEAGPHQVAWDGLDGTGRPVGPGVYFVRVETGAVGGACKLVVTK
jgi:flagellar hook assembly protein FlgD